MVNKLHLSQDLCAQNVATSAPDECTGRIAVGVGALI